MAIRARCIVNALEGIANPRVRARLAEAIHLDEPLTELAVGQVYTAVALEQRSGGIWLLLHTIRTSEFPYPYPLEMFEIVEASMPAGWCIAFEMQVSGLTIKRISFREWALDETFYERLVDRDAQALQAYEDERLRLE